MMRNLTKVGLMGLATLISVQAHARGYAGGMMGEDRAMVNNGQGVSSPSFWGGLSGANPAGLVNNTEFKLQGAAATSSDSIHHVQESGGAFAGNGQFGVGLQYTNYNDGSSFGDSSHSIDFGLAGTVETLHTAFGLSGHAYNGGGTGTYNAGALIDLAPAVRMGATLPDFTHTLQKFGAGFTYMADQMVDFVVDAGYNFKYSNGLVKPGISIHTNIIQATIAYGFRFTGTSDDEVVTKNFTGGLALKLMNNILIEYEYQSVLRHRLGLTLRFN